MAANYRHGSERGWGWDLERWATSDRSLESLILFFQRIESDGRGRVCGCPQPRADTAGNGQNHSGQLRVLVVRARTSWTSPAAMRGRRHRPCYPGPCSTLRSMESPLGKMNSSSPSAPTTLSSQPMDTRRHIAWPEQGAGCGWIFGGGRSQPYGCRFLRDDCGLPLVQWASRNSSHDATNKLELVCIYRKTFSQKKNIKYDFVGADMQVVVKTRTPASLVPTKTLLK